MPGSAPVLIAAELHGGCARVTWSDGLAAEFAVAWLLDNAPSARDAPRGQRLATAARLAEALTSVTLAVAEDTLVLACAAETVFWPGFRLRPWSDRRAESKPPDGARQSSGWPEGATMAERPPVAFQQYMTDEEALATALGDVARFGLVRLHGAGARPDVLETVVRRFGFIRETNYGRLFEVRVVTDPENLANSARALEPHTDNPYRDPVPTLQLLHCIRNAGEGGATVFLDGFALAQWLRRVWPDDFRRLARQPVTFAYAAADGSRYEARSPVIRLAADGEVTGLRVNHRSLAALDLNAAEAAAWYAAYLRLSQAAGAPERRLRVDLAPGDIVIFDNERILHGREAIGGAADRLLIGCYADRDALGATLARLGGAETISF